MAKPKVSPYLHGVPRVKRNGREGPPLHDFIEASGGIVGVREYAPAVTIFDLADGDTLALWDHGEDYGIEWQAGYR